MEANGSETEYPKRKHALTPHFASARYESRMQMMSSASTLKPVADGMQRAMGDYSKPGTSTDESVDAEALNHGSVDGTSLWRPGNIISGV